MWLCERSQTHSLGRIRSGTARATLFNAKQKRSQRRAKEICNKGVENEEKAQRQPASIPITAIHSLAPRPLRATKMSNAFSSNVLINPVRLSIVKYVRRKVCASASEIVNLNICNKNESQARDERMQRSYQSAS